MKPEPPDITLYGVTQGAPIFSNMLYGTKVLQEALMNKYIGFDMDCKKTVCCVIEADRLVLYTIR